MLMHLNFLSDKGCENAGYSPGHVCEARVPALCGTHRVRNLKGRHGWMVGELQSVTGNAFIHILNRYEEMVGFLH